MSTKKWHIISFCCTNPQEIQLISARDILNKFIYMNGGSKKKQVKTERDMLPMPCFQPQIFQW